MLSYRANEISSTLVSNSIHCNDIHALKKWYLINTTVSLHDEIAHIHLTGVKMRSQEYSKLIRMKNDKWNTSENICSTRVENYDIGKNTNVFHSMDASWQTMPVPFISTSSRFKLEQVLHLPFFCIGDEDIA